MHYGLSGVGSGKRAPGTSDYNLPSPAGFQGRMNNGSGMQVGYSPQPADK